MSPGARDPRHFRGVRGGSECCWGLWAFWRCGATHMLTVASPFLLRGDMQLVSGPGLEPW